MIETISSIVGAALLNVAVPEVSLHASSAMPSDEGDLMIFKLVEIDERGSGLGLVVAFAIYEILVWL